MHTRGKFEGVTISRKTNGFNLEGLLHPLRPATSTLLRHTQQSNMMWSPTAASAPTARPTSPEQPASFSVSRQKNRGRRIAQIVKLKPEFLEEYKKVHAHVWPEVLKQIKQCNIEDYSIFYDESSGILFASMKYVGYDYAGDMERMRENPKVREWWDMTDGWQESLVEGATKSNVEPGEPGWWKPVEEVFHLP
ncbi:hypothetical protein VDGL01_07812 [Verticillium dahliae]